MKHIFKRLAVLLGVFLLLPASAQAATGVPQEAIDARESVFRIFCEDEEWEYSGSSFVISADEYGTYIATNYHVVEDAFEDTIVIVLHDGEELPVEIVGYDQDADLCILKTAEAIENVAPLKLAADEKIGVGRAVYTLGFPGAGDYLLDEYAYAVDDITLTDGIISAVKHVTVDGSEITMLQMNATINSGSSGGPLLNSGGEVLGINSLQIAEANDVYAAVSVSHLRDLLEEYDVSLPVEEEKPQEAATADTAQTNEADGSKLIQVLIGVVVAALLAIGVFSLVKFRKKPLSLDVLMQKRLQPYSMEEAKQKLQPIVNSLVPPHIRGEAHGSIYPANIFVDQFGNLTLGKPHKQSGVNRQMAPYISMEQYAVDGTVGTYSDVYALGAVLYYLITRREPETVLARLQNDTLQASLDESFVTEEERAVLLTALALKREERPHDAGAFSHALQIQNQMSIPFQNQTSISFRNQPPTPVPMDPAQAYYPRRNRVRGNISRPAVLITCGVLLVGIFGTIWMVNGIRYRQAIRYLDQENYAAARDSITGTLMMYQDTKELAYYINSAYFLELGYYDEAKERFVSLDDYRNAKEMAQECDYQKALAVLETGDYADAKKAFEALGDYSDARNMALECEYQRASDLLKEKQYDGARRVFEKLADSNYRDASDMAKESIYQKAVDIYERFIKADPEDRYDIRIDVAKDLLYSIYGYSDANKMVVLVDNAVYEEGVRWFDKIVELHQDGYPNSDLPGADGLYESYLTKAQYYFLHSPVMEDSNRYIEVCTLLADSTIDWAETSRQLTRFWQFKPAQKIILCDSFIFYFLVGSWKGDGRYFNVKIRDDDFSVTDDFGYFYGTYSCVIEDLVYSIEYGSRGWIDIVRFSFPGKDTMEAYVFSNGKTYTLKRQ